MASPVAEARRLPQFYDWGWTFETGISITKRPTPDTTFTKRQRAIGFLAETPQRMAATRGSRAILWVRKKGTAQWFKARELKAKDVVPFLRTEGASVDPGKAVEFGLLAKRPSRVAFLRTEFGRRRGQLVTATGATLLQARLQARERITAAPGTARRGVFAGARALFRGAERATRPSNPVHRPRRRKARM